MTKFSGRIDSLRGQLNQYRAARDKILADRDLSQEAKVKRCKILKEQSGTAALTASGEMWKAINLADTNIGARMARAQAGFDARWDYTRLAQETSEAKAWLGTARNMAQIESAYAKAMDAHRARAMRTAILESSSRFLAAGGDEGRRANSLIAQVQRDDEQAKTPPEMAALEAEAGDLVDDVLAMEKLAKDLGNEFHGLPSALGGLDPFRAQIDNTIESITRKTQPDDPTKIIIEIKFKK